MSSFYAMLSRMKHINRWSLMRNSRNENLSEHSYEVIIVSHALALITNERFGGSLNVEKCVLIAIYHDVPEILTGDLPTPVKYFNPEIKKAYGKVEEVASDTILKLLPEDLRKHYEPLFYQNEPDFSMEYLIVKAADKLSAHIKCVEELSYGNKEFIKACISTEKAIRDMAIPAADLFLEEFIPAFKLTLDEQEDKR